MLKRMIFCMTLLLLVMNAKAQELSPEEIISFSNDLLRGRKGLPKDTAKAFELLMPLAQAKHPEAMTHLGMMHLLGQGTAPDTAQALALVSEAALAGNAFGQVNLGSFYKEGWGVAKDPLQAMQWYQKAADQQQPRAFFMLGYMHYKGIGVPQNYDAALRHFVKGAELQHPMAYFFLGLSYEGGYGVPKDYERAVEYWKTALKRGCGNAIPKLREAAQKKQDQVFASTYKTKSSLGDELKKYLQKPGLDGILVGDELPTSFLSGHWQGKSVFYDWSGEKILKETDLAVWLTLEGKKAQGEWRLTATNVIAQSYQFRAKESAQQLSFVSLQALEQPAASLTPIRLSQMDYEFFALDTTLYLLGNVRGTEAKWNEDFYPNVVLLERPMSPEEKQALEEAPNETNESPLRFEQWKENRVAAYPNPMQEEFTACYWVEDAGHVKVDFVDLNGTKIATLCDEHRKPGVYEDPLHLSLRPGVYILRLFVNGQYFQRLVVKE